MTTRGSVRDCSDADLVDFWCDFAEIFFQAAVLRFYKTKRFGVFRNFRVISMWFEVFLCYSVQCLYVILCSLAVFAPPLRPLVNFYGRQKDRKSTLLSYKVAKTPKTSDEIRHKSTCLQCLRGCCIEAGRRWTQPTVHRKRDGRIYELG